MQTDIIDAVQRMQNYIEAHISDNITLADLARCAQFSPWYSARLFRELTGVAPADYIRRLRLSLSALKLRDENVKISDVAFEMGFGSVDGYQRAFLREFGCNPKEYAKNPIPIHLFTPYGVKHKSNYKEEFTMESVQNVFIQVIDKPARKVIIKRGVTANEYWTYCNEVGCDVWGLLVSMKSISGEPVCMWLPKKYIKPNTSEYVQGVEVDESFAGEIPDGFDIISLPAAKYLQFQGEPFAEEDFCCAIEALKAAIAKYDPSILGYSYDADNPRIQLEPIGKRGYIELLSIK